MKTGVELIAEERRRQIEKEGWTPEHDAEHDRGELASAGACYALSGAGHDPEADGITMNYWPWDDDWWKPKNSLHDLVRSGALIAAEIDRYIHLYMKGHPDYDTQVSKETVNARADIQK